MEKNSNNNSINTALTPEEELQIVFSKFDTNKDGKISVTELAAVLNVLGDGASASSSELDRVMSELDKNGDGYLDLEEFKTFNQRADEKELKEAFALYDKDKNGKISASELHAVLKSLGEKCSIKDCKKMIGNVDVDGDGCVNFDEFKKMMNG